jgi:hypothetical protein
MTTLGKRLARLEDEARRRVVDEASSWGWDEYVKLVEGLALRGVLVFDGRAVCLGERTLQHQGSPSFLTATKIAEGLNRAFQGQAENVAP